MSSDNQTNEEKTWVYVPERFEKPLLMPGEESKLLLYRRSVVV